MGVYLVVATSSTAKRRELLISMFDYWNKASTERKNSGETAVFLRDRWIGGGVLSVKSFERWRNA